MSKSDYPKEFPCPVCGLLSRVGISKKEKPYFTCLDCGVQVFIRAQQGIQKFSSFKNSDLLRAIKNKSSAVYSKTFLMAEEIKIKKSELNFLENKLPLLGNETIENKIKTLKNKLEELENQYLHELTK